MAKSKSRFSFGSLLLGMLIAYLLLRNHEDGSTSREEPTTIKQEVRTLQEPNAAERFQTASMLLSAESASHRARGVRDVEDVARHFPDEYYAKVRDLLSSHVREGLMSGGTTEDEDIEAAIRSLLNLSATARSAHLATSPTTYDVDLSEMDLRGFDFSKVNAISVNLAGSDLRGANLWRGVFSKCNFSDADFEGANLEWASLADSDLSGADLSRADLRETSLIRCKLERTYLAGASLYRTKLLELDLSSARMLTQPQLEEACLNNSVTLGEYAAWYSGAPSFCPPHYWK